jgi:hypothetical protein
MPFDYTNAPERELIPAGTTATICMHIRPGDAGEDGMLKRSKDGKCEMLDIEYLVLDGPYAKRKFWENRVVSGIEPKHQDIANSNIGLFKKILDSSFGLMPNDRSPEARAKRNKDYKDFDGLPFIGIIGIEKSRPKNDGTDEEWPEKNILTGVITPDKRDWHPVEQPPPFNGGGAATGGAASTPSTPSVSSTSAPSTPALPVTRPSWAE